MVKAPQSRPPVEVGIRDLRNHLSSWLERVKAGEELVVTERGTPIARLSRTTGRERLDELIELGIVTPAQRPRSSLEDLVRVAMTPGPPIEDIVADQRR